MCICVYACVCMCVYDGFYTALQSNRSTVCREKGIVPITRISIIHQDNFHDGGGERVALRAIITSVRSLWNMFNWSGGGWDTRGEIIPLSNTRDRRHSKSLVPVPRHDDDDMISQSNDPHLRKEGEYIQGVRRKLVSVQDSKRYDWRSKLADRISCNHFYVFVFRSQAWSKNLAPIKTLHFLFFFYV